MDFCSFDGFFNDKVQGKLLRLEKTYALIIPQITKNVSIFNGFRVNQ